MKYDNLFVTGNRADPGFFDRVSNLLRGVGVGGGVRFNQIYQFPMKMK